jgi:1-hydroxycarotenoid 3,4-desaturase
MSEQTVIIGAGMAGISAAIDLAAAGHAVTVIEKAAAPGGKMRKVPAGNALIDAGPTVFTMRWVFDALCEEAGRNLEDYVTLRKAEVLARHAWDADQRLDLFADTKRTADAIGDFAGASEAQGFRDFCTDSARIYATLKDTFIAASRPNPAELGRRVGFGRVGDLLHMKPFSSMWQALGAHFKDPRLQQLFGRYATYVGSSPFDAPATLMLIAHVEAEGVWLVDGGMSGLAAGLAKLAGDLGVTFRYGTGVAEITTARRRVTGVTLEDGEHIAAGTVISNGDVAAFATGALGPNVTGAAPAPSPNKRSLSAVTWAFLAETQGFPLARHTVFFSDAYKAEFEAIFKHHRLPTNPTTYICAEDRDDDGNLVTPGPERLLCLINAPAIGDRHIFTETEIEPCKKAMFELLARCGLTIKDTPSQTHLTTPSDFARLFPGSGGAIYGQASHGWTASFQRPGARSRIRGLYLAGGSVHPGAGVPMAALSGRQAAQALMADQRS